MAAVTTEGENTDSFPVAYPPGEDQEPQSILPMERVNTETLDVKGFPPKALVKQNDKFLCGLCELLLRDPVQSICGHRFCKHCLSEVEPGTKCQQCEADDEEYTLDSRGFYPDPAVRREINKQPAKCVNQRCTWSGNFKEFLQHVDGCNYATVECECSVKVPKVDLDTHKKKQCSYRLLPCSYCNEEVVSRDIAQHLNVSCPEYPVQCPKACGKKVKRNAIEDHINIETGDCENIPCPFGCRETGTEHSRKSTSAHAFMLLQVILRLLDSFRNQSASHNTETGIVERRLGDIEKNVGNLQRKVERLEQQNMLKLAPESRSPNGTAHLQQRNNHDSTNELAVAAGGVSMNTSLSAMPDAHPFQPPTLQFLIDKQSIIESLVAVLNREVEKLINEQRNFDHQRTLSAASIEELNAKVASLERNIALKDIALAEQELRLKELEAASFDGTMVWVINDFDRKRQNAISGRTPSIYSSPFYTSKAGYKICARLYLNGDGSGKGTHLSLFFLIMRGQYDAILTWPFTQKVTLTLMDQNNNNSIVEAFRPDPNSSSFQRPKNNMNIASGVPLFCPLSRLGDRRNAYIKDDTMFLRIMVDTNGLT